MKVFFSHQTQNCKYQWLLTKGMGLRKKENKTAVCGCGDEERKNKQQQAVLWADVYGANTPVPR